MFRRTLFRFAMAFLAISELGRQGLMFLALLYIGDGVLTCLVALLAVDALAMLFIALRWPGVPATAAVLSLAVWALAKTALVLHAGGAGALLSDPRTLLFLGGWIASAVVLCLEARAQQQT